MKLDQSTDFTIDDLFGCAGCLILAPMITTLIMVAITLIGLWPLGISIMVAYLLTILFPDSLTLAQWSVVVFMAMMVTFLGLSSSSGNR